MVCIAHSRIKYLKPQNKPQFINSKLCEHINDTFTIKGLHNSKLTQINETYFCKMTILLNLDLYDFKLVRSNIGLICLLINWGMSVSNGEKINSQG